MTQQVHGFAAADLGATSGRVILGVLRDGRMDLTEQRRFETPTLTVEDELHWDFDGLLAEVSAGFDSAATVFPDLASVGIDTWGVDYGRLNSAGALMEQPFNYRDSRTAGVPDLVFTTMSAAELYRQAGLQVLPINTIFQLVSQAADDWSRVRQIVLLPDLFGYFLTGQAVAEATIASTTGLLDVAARQWSTTVCDELSRQFHLPLPQALPAIVEPGTILGPSKLGSRVPVVSVGGHDTASAVVAVPTLTDNFAFISSGTWSLVGVELDHPVLTADSQRANFTNELGVDQTVRYLKNVMGLWVLTESMRTWNSAGADLKLHEVIAAAADLAPMTCVLDMNDERLLPPGDMPARLSEMARETGQVSPQTPPEYARCIFDSLALAYRVAIRQASELSGRDIQVIHVVGGGCQNELLCQLTAEATGLPVLAGPAEATALGNLLVQARATGALAGDLMHLRRVARASSDLIEYLPGRIDISQSRWAAAERIAHRR